MGNDLRKRVLVIGGTGLFGKSIIRYFEKNNLLIEDVELTLLSRNPDNFRLRDYAPNLHNDIKVLKGDILDIRSLPENNFDFIIHAATDSTSGLSLECLDRSNQIVLGTRNVLDWIITNKSSRLLYISSGGIYGSNLVNRSLDENQHADLSINSIEDTYSISKAFAEHLCFLYGEKHALNFSIARCFTFFGEDLPLNRHFAIGNFIRDAINKRPILIKGDGKTIRSYMDQYDLANWLIKILFHGEFGDIYNVGSDREISLFQLALLIQNIAGNKTGVVVQGKTIDGQSRNRNYYVPDTQKFQTSFGINTSYELEETIIRVLHFNNYEN
jgi:UDP-glucuronate decarboxylase